MRKHDLDVAIASLEARGQRWSRRGARVVALCMAAGAAVLLMPSRASACGATPDVAYVLSPTAGAVDVPLNTALMASSSFRVVRFTLNEVGTGRAVPVSVSCEKTDSGTQLCQARPELLAAHTSYVWTVVPEPWPEAGATEPAPPQLRFTTGERTDQTAPLTNLTPSAAPLLTVDILEHVMVGPNNCGIEHNVRLRIQVPRLDEPAVLVGRAWAGCPSPGIRRGRRC
jgi:hypothetical protein